MMNKTKSFKRNILSISIASFIPLLISNTVLAACTDNQSSNNYSLSVDQGSYCEAQHSTYIGRNTATINGAGSHVKFLQEFVTITGVAGNAYALNLGGVASRPGNGDATVTAKDLIVNNPITAIKFSANNGLNILNARNLTVNHDSWTGIDMEGRADNLNDQLNITEDLRINTYSSFRSSGEDSSLKIINNGQVFVGGNTYLISTVNNNLGLNSKTGTLNFIGDLTTEKFSQPIFSTGSNITVGGLTTFNQVNQGTAIESKNESVITFKGNVLSNGEDTAIKNDNSTINFFGDFNRFDGYEVEATPTSDAYYTGGHIFNTNGLINLSNDVAGGILSVRGDYTGDNGMLKIDTEFKDDNSKTDKIIIDGTATGSTELQIVNAGGSGAQTVNGIHVIQTGSSESDQTFYLDGGAISVGAFDYLLHLKKQQTTDEGTFDNWYLESILRDGGQNTPTPADTPIYTPDVGEYLAAETMGNTLFTSRLEDREGASQYQKLGSNDTGNVWVRAYGGHNQFKSVQDQLKTKGNSFVTQIGASLVTLGEEDQFNLGAMGGFATYDGKTRSNLTDRESKTKINGYSLGLYGTWYAHPVEKRGAYIDSWVLWNKFNNKIDTPDQNQYKYDSSGITASIEAGGDYLLNKNGKKDWWIQPQAQLIYQGVHADDFKDAQNVDINHGRDNLQARMGVKTYLNIPTHGSKLTSYRPYVALNFIHNTNPYSVVIDDVRYENEGSANLGELKLGIEGQVTKNSQVWLNASYVAGSHDNQAYQGNIGWKYNF